MIDVLIPVENCMKVTERIGIYMLCCFEKEADYGNFSTSAERPKWNQDKSSVEPYQKADYLLFWRSTCGSAFIFLYQRGIGDTGGGAYHGGRNAAILFWQCSKWKQ